MKATFYLEHGEPVAYDVPEGSYFTHDEDAVGLNDDKGDRLITFNRYKLSAWGVASPVKES